MSNEDWGYFFRQSNKSKEVLRFFLLAFFLNWKDFQQVI
jgi:hypothetical protein